jgi:alpha-tubulin suppressor-like RCC1 family protein
LPFDEEILDVFTNYKDSLFVKSPTGLYAIGKNTIGQLGIGNRNEVRSLTKTLLKIDVQSMLLYNGENYIFGKDGNFIMYDDVVVDTKNLLQGEIISHYSVDTYAYILTTCGLYGIGSVIKDIRKSNNFTHIPFEQQILSMYNRQNMSLLTTQNGIYVYQNYIFHKVNWEKKVDKIIMAKNIQYVLSDGGLYYLYSGQKIEFGGKIIYCYSCENFIAAITDEKIHYAQVSYDGIVNIFNTKLTDFGIEDIITISNNDHCLLIQTRTGLYGIGSNYSYILGLPDQHMIDRPTRVDFDPDLLIDTITAPTKSAR